MGESFKFEQEFPIRACFLQTGLRVDTWFDGFLNRAREGDLQAKHEFVYALRALTLLGGKIRPDVIPADVCRDSLNISLDLFETLGEQGHAGSCLMAAVSYMDNDRRDPGQAKIWLDRAVKLGSSEQAAIANMKALIAATATPSAPGQQPQ